MALAAAQGLDWKTGTAREGFADDGKGCKCRKQELKAPGSKRRSHGDKNENNVYLRTYALQTTKLQEKIK